MNVSLNFTIPDPVQLVVYIIIALLATALAGGLARMRSGMGFVITFLFAALGAWLFANVLHIQIANDIAAGGVPLLEAGLGALLFAALSVLAFRGRRRAAVL